MAVREFKLPDVGEGLAEAEIVEWLVEEGDTVSEDQPVAEAETDKAVVEVPSPVNGTVREIRFEAGTMVPVGDVIITFDVEGEDEPASDTAEPEPTDDDGESPVADSDSAAGDDETAVPSGRVFAAPSARRVARELGVDITAVEGSGPGGRISDADVRAYAERDGEDDSEPAPTPATAGKSRSATRRVDGEDGDGTAGEATAGAATGPATIDRADRDRTLAAPATRRVAEEHGVDIDAVPTDQERDGVPFVDAEQVRGFVEALEREQATEPATPTASDAATATAGDTGDREDRIPYRGVRRTIGKQMERSKFTAPHVSHHDDAVVEALVEARAELKAEATARGVKLTYLPFVIKAVVAALKEFPMLNAELDEEAGEIVHKHYYNIGIAVATDAGLMVPVVKEADSKSLLEIAREANDLVEKARDRSISREEMSDGTFTITNFGAVGGKHATPVINHPESAILGLGAIEKEPVVVDDEVVPRHVMGLSLSIDHRVIDGAEAARFTNLVKRYLEEPTLLLLE